MQCGCGVAASGGNKSYRNAIRPRPRFSQPLHLSRTTIKNLAGSRSAGKNKIFLGKKLGRCAASTIKKSRATACPASCAQRVKELLGRGVPPPTPRLALSFKKIAFGN